MVMYRHSNNLKSSACKILRAVTIGILLVVLVACDSRDDLADSELAPIPADSAGTPLEGEDGVLDDKPSIAYQNPSTISTQIQTLEEQSVTGTFALLGESTGAMSADQTFSIVSGPSNGSLVLLPNSKSFTYTPNQDFFGSDTFVYTNAEGVLGRVVVDVINVNDPPTIFVEVQRVIEQGSGYNSTLIANDPDNERLSFQAENLPSWLSLDSRTGLVSGIPNQNDIGLFDNIVFRVTDGAGLSSEVTDVRIEVIETNDAPTINIDQFPADLDVGQIIEVHLFPDDPDDDVVELAFEPNELLDVSIEGATVTVIALEVSRVTDVNLVLQATDVRGGVTRATVPMKLHPVNGTGRGRTVFGRNASGEGIHLVVLGDGYRVDQQSKFREHVQTVVEKMQSDVGMKTHFSAWNIHMVETPSVDSGSDDNVLRDSRDTVYSTGYFCEQIRRLICGNRADIFTVAINEYPNFDQILVLVNDSRYGGSGGDIIAIASTESIEVALHEMGHSIAGLGDEYEDQYLPDASIPTYVEGKYANITKNTAPNLIPWKHWMNNSNVALPGDSPVEVGLFEGAYYRANGFYRPTEDSLMRHYDGELGPVNSEQWALSVYTKANSVVEISPVNRRLEVAVGEVVDFSVLPLFDATVQAVQWQLDSRTIPDSGTERPSIALSFPAGEFEVSLVVRDISGLIRKPEPHAGVFEWKWTVVVQ